MKGVFGPDHRRYRSRHSHVEAHGDSLDRSKVRFANGDTRKRIGHHRGSVRTPARIAMSCDTLLAPGRSDESPRDIASLRGRCACLYTAQSLTLPGMHVSDANVVSGLTRERTRVQDGVVHGTSAANSRRGLAGEGRFNWLTLTETSPRNRGL